MAHIRYRKLTYSTHKIWFTTVFSPHEWLTWTGRKILAEARLLGGGCDTETFCQIRREIITELHSRDIKQELERMISYPATIIKPEVK